MIADTSGVKTFKITITKNDEIRVETDHTIEPCTVNRNPLLTRTIEIFNDMLRDNRLREREEYEVLGAHLYSVLFDNPIGAALNKIRYENQGGKIWRVQLEFETGQEGLARWPWEYLYCPPLPGGGGNYFVAESAKLVLSRSPYLYSFQPRALLVEDLPIRVLFVAASPGKLARVEYETVLEDLQGLQDKIEVHPLDDPYIKLDEARSKKYEPKATFTHFLDTVSIVDPHIIHFIGHGRYVDKEGGQLAFMHEAVNGEVRWKTDKDIAARLREVASSLRLVFLQACESAFFAVDNPYNSYQPATSLYHNPYRAISGVAMHLANQNIPAVLAMQYRVESSIANRFARAFYTALVKSMSVDFAMQAARMEISDSDDWNTKSSFGLPVLYLRHPGALLAETDDAPGQARPPQTPQNYTGNASRINAATSSTGPSTGDAVQNTCPWCQRPVDPDDTYCVCGNPVKCPACKNRIKIKRPRCGNCNELLPLIQDTVSINK